MTRQSTVRPWTGRTVLYILLAFFGVMALANAVFVYLATDSWTGLAAEDAYRTGLAYNDTIARAERQNALGWRSTVELQRGAGTQARLVVSLVDAAGRPVASESVRAQFRRPVKKGHDFTAVLTPQADGGFAATVDMPLPGQWDVRIEIARAGAEPYLIEARLWPK